MSVPTLTCCPGTLAEGFDIYGKRIGIAPKRVAKLLDRFRQSAPQVEQLVAHSFLAAPIKAEYLAQFEDRRRALNYSFTGQL